MLSCWFVTMAQFCLYLQEYFYGILTRDVAGLNAILPVRNPMRH